MAYNTQLAEQIRLFLEQEHISRVEEKKMFSGLTFMLNGKMCISVSHDNLMCRFDPELQMEVEKRKGFHPMIMKGKIYKGYCYVSKEGYKDEKDFEYWLQLCIAFNDKAKATGKKRKESKNFRKIEVIRGADLRCRPLLNYHSNV